MSKKDKTAPAEKPKKEPKPKKNKAPKKSIDFSPVASAMFELQRREATGNVISGAACILIGIITIIVSIFKYISNMKKITVDADKMFAYAWIAIGAAGLIIIIIGVYEILKSFISMDQINEWARNAESHVSPLQSLTEKRQAAQMNQAQSTEPAPTSGMAQEGSKAKKHFAFLGKKEEPKPDSTAVYNKYNPPEKNQESKMAQPPKAKPLMEQKFDYGIHEQKKQTFADKFLAENKEDPFEKYRQELGVEKPKEEEFVQKPQFIRSAAAVQNASSAEQPQQQAGKPVLSGSGSLFEKLSAAQGLDGDSGSDDDGFFLGTTSTARVEPQQLQQQVMQLQQKVEQVELLQKQVEQVEELQKKVDQVADLRKLSKKVEQVDQVQQKVEQLQQQVEKVQAAQPSLSKQPEKPKMKATVPMPTIKPPPVPKNSASPTIKPPPIPKDTPSSTIKPPPIPQETPSSTIKPPPIPKETPSSTIKPPPIPKNTGAQAQAPAANMAQPPFPNYGAQPVMYPQGGYMQPFGYQQMPPVQNMYQPLPNLRGMQGMMPNQGFQGGYNAPFGFVGSFVDNGAGAYNPAIPPYTMSPFPQAQQPGREQAYNPAMPPYTVHPFRQAQGAGHQEQAYNPAMPPYTVHPLRPSSGGAVPPITQSEQAYNSAMPPYTVHAFKPSSVEFSAPPTEKGESYNSAMPPYTVHPFKKTSVDLDELPDEKDENTGESYNSAMPPYTVHPLKMASAALSDSPKESGEGTGESYNSAMPPYTVHPYMMKNGAPALYDPTKDNIPNPVPSPEDMLPKAVTPPASVQTAEPVKAMEPVKAPPAAPIPEQQTAPDPKPEPKPEAAPEQKPAPAPQQEQPAQQPKRTQRGSFKGVMTQRGQNVKKPPITQRLGEYKFSLFEELGGRVAAPKTKRGEAKKNPNQQAETTGGKDMAFNFNGSKQAPERKKSFSEKFLNRNGKNATERKQGGSSDIVQNGTPAQRKFVDASEYDEWECPGCGSINQEYVGVCSCGERKPRTKW